MTRGPAEQETIEVDPGHREELTPFSLEVFELGGSELPMQCRLERDEGVTAAITGARKPEQIDGWFDAAGIELTATDLADIAAACSS